MGPRIFEDDSSKGGGVWVHPLYGFNMYNVYAEFLKLLYVKSNIFFHISKIFLWGYSNKSKVCSYATDERNEVTNATNQMSIKIERKQKATNM